MGPYGGRCQNDTPPTIRFEFALFQAPPEFSSEWSSQMYSLEFSVSDLTFFSEISICIVELYCEMNNFNREYLAPLIRSMNNRFHSEAKLPWSYDYPLANHIATNKSSTNRLMPLFSRLYPSFGYLRKIFPPRGLKYSLLYGKRERNWRYFGSQRESTCIQRVGILMVCDVSRYSENDLFERLLTPLAFVRLFQ